MHSQFAGFYPFTVSVWNFFDPHKEATNDVKLKVTFNHHRCFFYGEVKDNIFEYNHFKVENDSTSSSYTIEPGKSQAFPMYFGDETVVISFENLNVNVPLPNKIRISSRDTALCSVCIPGKNGAITVYPKPEKGSNDGYIDIEGEDNTVISYYKGGIWEIDKVNENWELTIRKKVVDPQSDDVTIGPGTPG